MRKPVLGRGLDAILGSSRATVEVLESSRPEATAGGPQFVPIEKVSAGRAQPRRHFDDASLGELADSIRANGILQPLLVKESNGIFELIAGERRLRAAARAGLETIPVVIKNDVTEEQMVELALIENVQREDLTPIEQARGYQRLLDNHGYTQEQLAVRIGKSRVAITNVLRLMKLPREVCDLVDQRLLSESHARALLSLRTAAQQIRVAARVAREQLSVRETEALVRQALNVSSQPAAAAPTKSPIEEAMRTAEQSIGRGLGTKVRIRGSAARGRIEIEFYSPDELNRLIERLGS